MSAEVVAVCCDVGNNFTKPLRNSITLIEGIGVEGDAHSGATVQHLYLQKKDAAASNLRQVHLIQAELFDELRDKGFDVQPEDIGENITTHGVDLLSQSLGTHIQIGDTLIELTGIRTPCHQIDKFQTGLLKAVAGKKSERVPNFRTGVMGIVLKGGSIQAGDGIAIIAPAGKQHPLPAL
jgi:MOSC domain-containing protein YiiM